MVLIKISNVTKKFGEIKALDSIDLDVINEEYLCILGPTGAGKTTLLRIIAGLLNPDQGDVYIDGKWMNNVPPEGHNAVYMFQQYALFPHMNVWKNVSFGPLIKNMDKKRIDNLTSEILEMVRLENRKDAYPNELSGGMQQRVALARGLSSGSRILLLDEPLGALDARLRVDIRAQLRQLVKDQKLTAIHVTHDQEEALMIADRIAIIRNGEIEQIGTPHETYLNPKSIFVTSFVGGANFFEGNIRDKKHSVYTIEIRGGIKIRVLVENKKLNQKVVIAVRREDILINKKKKSGYNNLSCKIVSSMFVGDMMEYRIRLKNDEVISSRLLLSNIGRKYKIGEQIFASFSKESCFIFPYPKAGLLKEIEAI
jgi:spermidine/putrescine transport system ATP-binding protein